MIENNLISTSLQKWNEHNKRLLSLVEKLSEEQLEEEIALGKNTGKYLLGHLAAINNHIIVLFGLAKNPQPELDDIFLFTPDKTVAHNYTVAMLKQILLESIQGLDEKIKGLTEAEWLDRHMNVSDEDFKTQTHRNKINVLINRTLHLAYHLGQLSLLKQKPYEN